MKVDDFNYGTMHNLLYFLYTGRVNLHFGTAKAQLQPYYPTNADGFELYRAADFYGIQTLQNRCFRFLMQTRTTDNLCRRLFVIKCEPYKELQQNYISFVLKDYEEIKVKEDGRAVFMD